MNVLIVYAHPEPQSFLGQLKERTVDVLTQEGHALQVSDLYAMRFKSTADPGDFKERYDSSRFDLQVEQRYAAMNGTFAPDILEEQRKLIWAETVLFFAPLWWYSVPAILKGWIDRVLAAGFAYGQGAGLGGRRAMLTLTTGGHPQPFTPEKRAAISAILDHIQRGTLDFCGFDVLPPYAIYGGDYATPEQRRHIFDNYAQLLQNLPHIAPVDYTPPGGPF